MLSSLAHTEAVAGSDFAALQCKAKREEEKYILSGSKIFVCHAGEAGINSVLARTTESFGVGGLSLLFISAYS